MSFVRFGVHGSRSHMGTKFGWPRVDPRVFRWCSVLYELGSLLPQTLNPPHSQLRLGPLPPPRRKLRPRAKPFCFKTMWLQDASCVEVVSTTWYKGLYEGLGPMFTSCMAEVKSITYLIEQNTL